MFVAERTLIVKTSSMSNQTFNDNTPRESLNHSLRHDHQTISETYPGNSQTKSSRTRECRLLLKKFITNLMIFAFVTFCVLKVVSKHALKCITIQISNYASYYIESCERNGLKLFHPGSLLAMNELISAHFWSNFDVILISHFVVSFPRARDWIARKKSFKKRI